MIPTPEKYKDNLREHIKSLLAQKVIRKEENTITVTTSWIPVPKKSGAIRWCLDCRPRNSVTLETNLSLPPLTSVLAKMSGCKFFSSYDMTSCFYQFCLHPSNYKHYTFMSPDNDVYYYVRAPFGGRTTTPFYKRCFQIFEEHLKDVKNLLNRLSEFNIVLNASKCSFGQTTIDLFGFILSEKGYIPMKSRVEKLEKIDIRTTKSELKLNLAALAYYRGIIKTFAQKAAPLFARLKESAKFDATAVQRPWKEPLKAAAKASFLTKPDLNLKLILKTDSSKNWESIDRAEIAEPTFEDNSYPLAGAITNDRQKAYT
ncbi:unnamed protein product [Oikopleura dioica]|uniref:Reverse transcriptase domain-containing protein n=1 Tax=Oikopleura dioica TaxID=34765 RepID=E4XM97_OIKDI|nr:unnamed protein product [Oikopleura dioica]